MDRLRELPDDSVHCCVTSPPYYGLRSYNTESQVWGGDPACEHEWGEDQVKTGGGGHIAERVKWQHTGTGPSGHPIVAAGTFCHCGAWCGDLGLEPTVELYLAHMVEVFRAARRVLRSDGTLWLNIGDSYAGSWGAQSHRVSDSDDPSWHSSQIKNHPKRASNTGSIRDAGLKPKDLMMIPAQLALALRADGWWLRSEIVWAKRAPMPESVTDRPTCAHEKVFLLSKSARYFYDAEVVKEEARPETAERYAAGYNASWKRAQIASVTDNRTDGFRGMPDANGGRNMRNVWHLGPEPFPEAHFATFVSEIPRRAILAGTSERGVCPQCGAPWARVVESESRPNADRGVQPDPRGGHRNPGGGVGSDARAKAYNGWRATCSCEAGSPIPATVLDPFLGSGTALVVADRLARNGIGIELSSIYARMAERRLTRDVGPIVRGDVSVIDGK